MFQWKSQLRFSGIHSLVSISRQSLVGHVISKEETIFRLFKRQRDPQWATQKNVWWNIGKTEIGRSREEYRTPLSTEKQLTCHTCLKSKQQNVDFTRFELITNLSYREMDFTSVYSRVHSFRSRFHKFVSQIPFFLFKRNRVIVLKICLFLCVI